MAAIDCRLCFHRMRSATAGEAQRRLQETLRGDHSIILAVLYGSAAADRLAPGSDVDVAAAGSEPMSVDDRVDLASRLELRIGRPVHLVDLRTLEGLILHQVLSRGLVLKNAVPGLLAFFMKKMLYHQADMMPLLERMLLAKAKGFAHGQGPRSQEAGGPEHVHRPD